MYLEDYHTALMFRLGGVPPAAKWVTALEAEAAAASWAGLM